MQSIARFAALGVAVLLAATVGASAQTPTPFDMKGTWKGTGEAIVDGPAMHHPPGTPAKAAGKYRLRTQAYVYKIDGQDGKRFWGTASGENIANERLVGTLSMDGKWIYMAAAEGILDGVVVDADTIQMCYRQVTPAVAVVACNEMKRQK